MVRVMEAGTDLEYALHGISYLRAGCMGYQTITKETTWMTPSHMRFFRAVLILIIVSVVLGPLAADNSVNTLTLGFVGDIMFHNS